MKRRDNKIFFFNIITFLFLIITCVLIIYICVFNDYQYHLNLLIFCITLLILLIVTFFLKRNIREITLISFVSFLIAIYFAEIILHFKIITTTDNETLAINYIKSKSVKPKYFDNRTKIEVIEDYRLRNIIVKPALYPKYLFQNGFLKFSNIEKIPLGGISNSLTILCNESGKYAFFESDRYGFNNPDPEWDSKVGYFLIGDSFTHGSCVNYGEDIGGHIRKLTKKSVINVGSGGNGPLTELGSFIEYGIPTNPKYVLWFYFEGNDLNNLRDELTNPILLKYLDQGFNQSLIKMQDKIDENLNKYIEHKHEIESLKSKNSRNSELLDNIKDIFKLSNIRRLLKLSENLKQEEILKKFTTITERLNYEVKNIGSELYFIYIPYFVRYTDFIKDKNNFYQKSKVMDIISKNNIKIIDLDNELFKLLEDPINYLPNRSPGHFTREGYKLIAKKVVNRIYE